jgi:hypothetical protein
VLESYALALALALALHTARADRSRVLAPYALALCAARADCSRVLALALARQAARARAAALLSLPPEALVAEEQLPLLSLPPEAFVAEPLKLTPVAPLGSVQLPLPSASPESTALEAEPPPACGAPEVQLPLPSAPPELTTLGTLRPARLALLEHLPSAPVPAFAPAVAMHFSPDTAVHFSPRAKTPELTPVTPLGAEQLPLPSAPPELSTPLSIQPSQPPPARGTQLQVDTALVAAVYAPPPTLSPSPIDTPSSAEGGDNKSTSPLALVPSRSIRYGLTAVPDPQHCRILRSASSDAPKKDSNLNLFTLLALVAKSDAPPQAARHVGVHTSVSPSCQTRVGFSSTTPLSLH